MGCQSRKHAFSQNYIETFPKIPLTKNPHNSRCKGFCKIKTCCRGRDRTFTRQLAITQMVSVVDPGRNIVANTSTLCYVYPVILTPETRGHVCQKFHHPTIFLVNQLRTLKCKTKKKQSFLKLFQ